MYTISTANRNDVNGGEGIFSNSKALASKHFGSIVFRTSCNMLKVLIISLHCHYHRHQGFHNPPIA